MTASQSQSNSSSKARLIPEKTIELWNAFALRDILGPDTWIWSPPRSIDQSAGLVDTSQLKKVLLLEFKAPYKFQPGPPYTLSFDIKASQLARYVREYSNKKIPDVLYVLPYTPWNSPPSNILPTEANSRVHRSFAKWAFVVRASHLYRLLRIVHFNTNKRALPETATVHLLHPQSIVGHGWCHWHFYPNLPLCTESWKDEAFWDASPPIMSTSLTVLYSSAKSKTPPYEDTICCTTLLHVLTLLKHCSEVRGIAFRSSDLMRDHSRQYDQFDLLYGPSIDRETGSLDDGIPSENEWRNDVDLLLADESLLETSNALLTASDDDVPVPRDDVPDEDAASPSTLMAVGIARRDE